jgi:hypothetical protein
MVTIKCVTKDCLHENVEFNFVGNPDFVECGQCSAHIIGTDLRDDPEPEPEAQPEPEEA